MSEEPGKSRGLPSWSASVALIVFWTPIFALVLYFVVDTPYHLFGIGAAFLAMIGSGLYLAQRTGGIRRKRIQENL